MINKISTLVSKSAQKIVKKNPLPYVGNLSLLKKPIDIDVFVGSSKSKKDIDIIDRVADFVNDAKIKHARKTYKKIDFCPAKTIEEAHEFATKIGASELNLGENDNLDVLNYLNEGFVKFKNAHLGLAQVPRRVSFADSGESNLMSANSMFRSFIINNNVYGINQIDEQIQIKLNDIIDMFCEITDDGIEIPEFYSTESELKYAKKLIDAFIKDKNSLDYGQKNELFKILSDMFYNVYLFACKPKDFAKGLFARDDVLTSCSLERKQKYLDRILNASTNAEATSLLTRTLAMNSESFRIKISNKKFSTLFHEMGHLQDYFQERTPASGRYKSEDLYPESLKEWLSNERKQNIAFNISGYATTGPGEFIAETYSKLLSGDSVPKEAIDLYKELKGPKIPDII